MKFESVKCDCCGRVQDGANHWLRVILWVDTTGKNTIALGPYAEGLSHHGMESQTLDLCGQLCALKLIAKLLGWSTPVAAE